MAQIRPFCGLRPLPEFAQEIASQPYDVMDAKEAAKFVNLLNDDYVTSDMTGIKYELKGKKELRVTESSDE